MLRTTISRNTLGHSVTRGIIPSLCQQPTPLFVSLRRGAHTDSIRDNATGYPGLTTRTGVQATPPRDRVLFHPVYTPQENQSVAVLHRDAEDVKDKVALAFAKTLRWGFDLVSGYRHKEIPPDSRMTLAELREGGYVMNESQWLRRILFLESIAGVPGFVAATLRHLRSLRLMRGDQAWIRTLLEEAENERMHLMTFMTLKNPGILFRAMVLGAQGVFYNLFFFSYLLSPSTAHRFVGYLEEEAVITYTRAIQEMEAGRLPAWSKTPAPPIARDYWQLGDNAKLLDVLYAVRSDEASHRFVNHSFASLDYKTDANPFAIREPSMTVRGTMPGFERPQSEDFIQETINAVESRSLPAKKSGSHT